MRISDWSSDVCSSDLPAQYRSLSKMRYCAGPGMASACRLDIALRIDRRAVVQHFEMHMRSSGTSGRTDAGDNLPARHLVTDVAKHLAVITIPRRITVAVIDLHTFDVAGAWRSVVEGKGGSIGVDT